MVEVSRHMAAAPERVWAELGDGWMYTGWVVGASHIRGVDGNWPEPGARLHHQVGVWPLVVSDSTAVLESEPPRRLALQARAWPVGEARVVLTIAADGEGSRVSMDEWPTNGVARWLHTPLQDVALRARNRESLNRLASIVENRPLPGFPPSGSQASGSQASGSPVSGPQASGPQR